PRSRTSPHITLSLLLLMIPPPPTTTLFPYTTLFRSDEFTSMAKSDPRMKSDRLVFANAAIPGYETWRWAQPWDSNYARVKNYVRSEEHTSELQSRGHLVCRLLLEKKKKKTKKAIVHK